MNLSHLRYFLKLAELQHYTKASEVLDITQPSLSHAVSQLERELGVPLFEREGRNIVITRQGKQLYEYVMPALSMLDEGVDAVSHLKLGAGCIDVGLLRTLGSELVPSLVRGFLKERSELELTFRFHTGLTPDLLQSLKDKQIDLAFCSKRPGEVGVSFYPVARQELVLLVPNNHPLAGRQSIHLEETLSYRHIAFSKASGLRPIVDSLFRKIGQMPDIVFEIAEDEVIAGMVAHGFGIAVVPRFPMLTTIDAKIITIDSPAWERLFYLAVPANTYLSPAVNSFVRYVIAHARV